MLKHYLMITLRNLLKYRTHSVLTILGLAVGFAASAIIIIINYTEMNYDQHWNDSDKIYKIESTTNYQAENNKTPFVYSDLYEIIKSRISEVELISRLDNFETKIKYLSNSKYNEEFQEHVAAIDSTFFKIFNQPTSRGNITDFYTDDSSIVITDELANKLFGIENPIGKTINIETTHLSNSGVIAGQDNSRLATFKDYKIVATLAKTSDKTSMNRQNVFVHIKNEQISEQEKNDTTKPRHSRNYEMYVKLKPGENLREIQNSLPEQQDSFASLSLLNGKKISQVHSISFLCITDVHLKGAQTQGQIERIFMLFGLAAIILLMACINYINLSLAAYSRRQKEIALRKTMGAAKNDIVLQFLSESLLITSLALLTSLILIEISMPWLKTVVNLNIERSYIYAPQIIGYLLLMALSVGLICGAYPSFYLSRFNPAATLKSNKSIETPTSIRFRKTLVISQFVISGIMLTSVSIIAMQMHKAQSFDPGYQTRNIIFATHPALHTANRGNIQSLIHQISRIPGVQIVTLSMPSLLGKYSQKALVSRQGEASSAVIELLQTQLAGPDDLKAFNIKLIAGRYFSALPNPEETSQGMQDNIYINQQALAPLGFKTAQEAINQKIYVAFGPTYKMPMTIMGVTPAVHVGSLNAPDLPSFFWPISNVGMPIGIAIRYEGGDRNAIAEKNKSIWKEALGYSPHSWFIENSIADEYKNENLIARFVYIFTGIAIFISCIGLYGLATHATTKRKKEIGLRKIHGASVFNIVKLLLWQFSKPVLLANVIIWPIALYAGSRWLEQFVDRIDIWLWGPLFCFVSALLAILIAWLTVGGHAFIVAREKPVLALREE